MNNRFAIQTSLKFQNLEEKTARHQKLIYVLDMLDPRELFAALERIRGDRGNGASNWVLFNCLIAFMLWGARKVTEGIRLLEEDKGVRDIVGIGAWEEIPSVWSFYRFIIRLCKQECQKALEEMFVGLVKQLKELLPGFGKHLVGDSTKIHSYASGRKLSADEEASWKKLEKKIKDPFGKLVKNVEKWFGYKAHFLTDADYELPIAFYTSTAKYNDNTIFPKLWQKAKTEQPWILEVTNYVGLDMGYDDGKVYKQILEDNMISIIKIRNMVEEENKCIDLGTAPVCPNNLGLTFDGYERKRKKIRYRKPRVCKISVCNFRKNCSLGVVRISPEKDPRKLVPIPRDTLKFKRLNNKRTSIERVNSRLKEHYNLDGLKGYGLKTTNLFVNLSLLCMNAFALYIAKRGDIEEVRRIHYALAA